MPHITALRQLKRVIKNTPDDLLHMDKWAGTARCGTVRCAAGWAAVDPWFNEHGFTAHPGGSPTYAGKWPFDSLRAFFRLTGAATDHLFAIDHPGLPGGHAVSKRQILNQIDRIIAGEPTHHYRIRKPAP